MNSLTLHHHKLWLEVRGIKSPGKIVLSFLLTWFFWTWEKFLQCKGEFLSGIQACLDLGTPTSFGLLLCEYTAPAQTKGSAISDHEIKVSSVFSPFNSCNPRKVYFRLAIGWVRRVFLGIVFVKEKSGALIHYSPGSTTKSNHNSSLCCFMSFSSSFLKVQTFHRAQKEPPEFV